MMNKLKRLILLLAWIPALASGVGTNVATDIGLTGIRIHAVSMVHADANTLWATLTDYNRLASFVPGMTLSRIVSPANARTKLVEQKGEGGLLSFVLPDHVVLAMDERPYRYIGFKSVSGLVTTLRGEWTIEGQHSPLQLHYRAYVLPLLPPPPALTDGYVQDEIRQRIDAVVREAERRMKASYRQ